MAAAVAGCAGGSDPDLDAAAQQALRHSKASEPTVPPRFFDLQRKTTPQAKEGPRVPAAVADRPRDKVADRNTADHAAIKPLAPPRETASLAPAAKPANPTSAHLTPARLKGLTGSELKAMLGEPTLLSSDGPAQLWQYLGSGCVLHVFLYEDHGAFRVTYSRVRVDDPDVANPPICVDGKAAPQARL